ncbi:hypothetical protein DAPPUDRAFT_233366 [Daphnia pulex]|uniref:Uncharacterized protein n=1 Tax=Daphnia pulex TaxID=6669 RepID=E9FTW6_DAPPU|nr:hypothetical protein DAPPUDRAFT_233366 [Daphnia pulex]|eukprot:EFX89570.1 hypothetical protein DAPPUDRAFT_233366 [Daphnia pulex]
MRFYTTVWLMLLVLSLLVVLESVSSYPASENADESIAASRLLPAGRKHSKSIAKEGKTKSKKNHHHHNRHSSRGLKQVTDYDYAASTTGDATGSPVSRKPISKDDRSPWSEPKHRRNKKSGGGGPNRKNNNNKKRSGTKQEKQLDKRKAAVMRTARRAEAFDNINDDTAAIDSTAAGQQNLNQLLGLGKPRPLLPPASQLKPFVSVGVFGDMRKFFDELRTNLDVETVAAEAAAAAAAAADGPAPKVSDDDLSQIAGLEDYEELPNYQALRTATGSERGNSSPVQQQQRRYSRLRGFVAMGGPGQSETSRHHHRSHHRGTGIYVKQ